MYIIKTNIINRVYFLALILPALFLFLSCEEKKQKEVLFQALTSDATRLDFNNKLNSTDSFNLFKYMYFYNGAGVAAGDFNNDGLTDIFFASNQGRNSLYQNQGGLKFKNVTKEAEIPDDGGWSTGVSVVDINNDGLLDIYVSRVSKFMTLQVPNQFLICTGISNGIPRYEDQAKKLGLDFSGFGTQAAFLDFDLDGDLDVFLLNHSIHHTGNFSERKSFKGTFHPTSGSRFYRNDSGVFTDITKACGINSTAIGYGLGIAVSDINLDGYPDIYIGNDFHENDYLYINQKNGQFTEAAEQMIMHTSKYTMGVDVADISNDGLPEIVSTDMLPATVSMLKRSPGEDNYDVFNQRILYGYSYQYSRNALQYNRGNNNFSEIGLYSGIAATDWSWSALLFDFNNDGKKDLFISNGIPKRLNDIDYINYISDAEIQQRFIENKISEKDKTLIDKFPVVKIPNKFFLNSGNMFFNDIHENISNEAPSFSNGAAYADFDNDGDLDIVVNNIEDEAIIYANKADVDNTKRYLLLKLRGPQDNINALGAKVIVFVGNEIRTYEKNPVKGFLSSTEGPLHIGLGDGEIDSMLVVWPDNTYQPFTYNYLEPRPIVTYKKGLPAFDYSIINNRQLNNSVRAADITDSIQINYLHKENKFSEFDREPLMPHMVSTEGPALAVADINGDKLDDVFIGSSKGYKGAVYIQQRGGKFVLLSQPDLDADSSYEDVDACWTDVNSDKHPDLVIASGGNEYYGRDRHLLPRVYLNNGSGLLTKKQNAIDSVFHTSSCVAPYDFNNDGYIDLFIGGRIMPWEYGRIPPSYLLQNDGTGKFTDVTGRYSNELGNAGFITKAIWLDLNNDNRKDLVLCGEWGTIDAYINNNGKFTKEVLCDKKGWWNTIVPCDVNGDGKIDLVAGNLGLNSRLKASDKEPVRLYYNDFDDNGKKEQILTYYLDNKEIPFAHKSEIERQMPTMRKKFLYAKDFAKASLKDIVGEDKLESAELFSANYFSNCILINRGNLKFEVQPLPWEAQLTPVKDAMIIGNSDKFPNILLMGNYYASNVEMGRYDAGFGAVLVNDGKGNLRYENISGISIKGEARNIRKILINGREACIVARNNDSTMVIRIRESKF